MAIPLFRPFPPPEPPLTDGIVILRLPRDADAPAIAAACGDPEIARWIPVPVPYGLEDARAFLAAAGAGWASGREPTFVIADATSRELVGAIAVHRHPDEPGKAAVGYWLAPQARGRGLATRAVRLIVRWAFGLEAGLVRMELLPWWATRPRAAWRCARGSCGKASCGATCRSAIASWTR